MKTQLIRKQIATMFLELIANKTFETVNDLLIELVISETTKFNVRNRVRKVKQESVWKKKVCMRQMIL